MHYGLIYPFREYETGRNLRLSPIYPRLREAGAVFGQVMGYERPTYFDPDDPARLPDGSRPYRIARTDTFGKPPWYVDNLIIYLLFLIFFYCLFLISYCFLFIPKTWLFCLFFQYLFFSSA